ncbi:carbamoyltransferase [Pseudobutyrivibrio sp. ACV-2]|uniref:carbamoyltransferase C-terminal domain-containing protein n=1 Tax=Pseudobutyrivibrio sp. ACV-2 TaxID=1520801 RepID=UPI000897D1E1|nr:carbamoyltransferase C-terminal domain-containing protein [Pseudobutyrivibrio sp. ACV-2]SEA96968.1 carbamoyltransferase [Pseudobutyrivibrio sp. ACV-2]
MRMLGFYIGGHDSSVSLCDSDGKIKYFKLERIIQSKHKKGNLEWIKKICDENDFCPEFVCYSDGNRNGLGICDEGLLWQEKEPLDAFLNAKTICIDHHYAHILSAFPLIHKTVDFGICVDGRGDHQIKCSVIENPYDIYKSKMIYQNKNDAYCLMFNEIGKLMQLEGGELDYAGKIMGAHAYGKANLSYIEELEEFSNKYGVSETLKLKYENHNIKDLCMEKTERFYDWLASYHQWIENRKICLFRENTKPNSSIVYAGGGAQNTVINERLSKKFNLIIPPHCYDGGISLGCMKFLSKYLDKNIYIEEFPFCQWDQNLGYASANSIDKVVDLLSSGKIVGWCQGRSEIGPRALGHRSILMDPTIPNAKDILNKRVKKRENWRPFAASILEGDVKRITGESRKLEYMLYAVQVLPEYQGKLRGVIHVDGTCRFQSVSDTKELHSYYELIKHFKDKTGVPGVINTSYNSSGMPIASSRDDVIKAFDSLDLDALCLGDEVIIRKR